MEWSRPTARPIRTWCCATRFRWLPLRSLYSCPWVFPDRDCHHSSAATACRNSNSKPSATSNSKKHCPSFPWNPDHKNADQRDSTPKRQIVLPVIALHHRVRSSGHYGHRTRSLSAGNRSLSAKRLARQTAGHTSESDRPTKARNRSQAEIYCAISAGRGHRDRAEPSRRQSEVRRPTNANDRGC